MHAIIWKVNEYFQTVLSSDFDPLGVPVEWANEAKGKEKQQIKNIK